MSTEYGLIVGGQVIPGTEWVRRESTAWIAPGDLGTRQRSKVLDVLVAHWTGGCAGLKSFDDDGPFIYRVFRGRKRADGSPLDVGVHFVVGACEPGAEYAKVWQLADPGLTACVHVGDAGINRRSVGVEVVSAGLPGPLDLRHQPQTTVALLGRIRKVLAFYPGQIASWTRLAETLAALDGDAGIRIPRLVPSTGASARFSRVSMRTWAGACEHLHVRSTQKIDAAGLLIDALSDAGWARVQP
jgi:hypothetical protein